ncbi:hypothetical protein BGW80DRAFT_1312793, partial [Lactifluus volemus]
MNCRQASESSQANSVPAASENGDAAAAIDYTAPEHAEMYKEVLGHFRNDAYRIPGVRNGKLSEEERFWLMGSGQAAIERLEGTLRWRRKFGVYDLTAEQVEPEAVTGKEFIFGYDAHGRPALYMVPSRQNTEESPRQIQFVSIVLMINFADRGKNPSFATSKLVLNILQTHYPERLANSLILNVPFLIQA